MIDRQSSLKRAKKIKNYIIYSKIKDVNRNLLNYINYANYAVFFAFF